MSGVGVQGYLGFILFFLVLVCVFLVYYYAEAGFPWQTYVTLSVGYYAGFGILLLVPIDIASCVYYRRSDAVGTYQPYDDTVNLLSSIYSTFFVIVLIFGSFLLVFEEYFNTDGYFTIPSKIASCLYRWCYDTIVSLVAGLIVLGILIKQHVVAENSDALLLTSVIVTNIVYELFLMFLLAYGLVEFPRRLWNMADLDYYLLLTQMSATADFQLNGDFKTEIQETISKVHYVQNMIPKEDAELSSHVQVIMSECPAEFKSKRKADADQIRPYLTKQGKITLSGLANLRLALTVSKNKYKMAQLALQSTQARAYYLEDLIASRNSGKGVIHWSLKNQDSTAWDYKWHITIKPMLSRIMAAFCALLSIFSFLGAISSMSGVNPSNSVYFLAVHDESASPTGIVIFIFITLSYAVYVSMWALFQMRFFGMMEMAPHSTSPVALSFNVRMVARLAAPLAFFYLGWLSENGLDSGSWTSNDAPDIAVLENFTLTNYTNISGTVVAVNYTVYEWVNVSQAIYMPSSFSNFYQLQKVAIIKNSFGTLYPVILLILVPLFLTNVLNRFLVWIKCDNLQFGTPIPTEEQLRDGKRQLAKYRKLAERGEQRGMLSAHLRKKKGGEGGVLGFFRGSSTEGEELCRLSENAGMSSDSPADIEAAYTPKEPDALSGMIEKKGSSKLAIGSQWKDVYAEVRSPGILCFYKDIPSSKLSPSDRMSVLQGDPHCMSSVDLKTIINFLTPPKKANKDTTTLELELADENVKMRFKGLEERDRWHKLLMEWKDFKVDYDDRNEGEEVVSPMASSSSGPKPTSSAVKASVAKDTKKAAAEIDLDSIVVDDDGVPSVPVAKAPTASKPTASVQLTSTTSGTAARPNPVSAPIVATTAAAAAAPAPAAFADDADDKPIAMEGWLEKKGHGKISNDWARRYCRIDEATCSFVYYKSSNKKDAPQGSLDLRYCDINTYDKSGKPDFSRFNIDTSEKSYKFKAVSATEGEKWVKNLNEWKDYFLMNTSNI